MNRYIRLAGLDVAGATAALKFPGFSAGGQAMANVVNLGEMRALRRGPPASGGSED